MAHFALIHLEATPLRGEEVLVAVAGAGKTVIAAPLDALPDLLPLLDRAVQDQPRASCPACSAALPAAVLDDQRPPGPARRGTTSASNDSSSQPR